MRHEATNNALRYFREIERGRLRLSMATFHPFALATKDGGQAFYPHPSGGVSHSMDRNTKAKNYLWVQTRRLETIMHNLNHTRVDVMNIDIESTEIYVIPEALELWRRCACKPRLLLIDIDAARRQDPEIRKKGRALVQQILNAGYSLYWDKYYDMTFIAQDQ